MDDQPAISESGYGSRFYGEIEGGSLASASAVLPILFELVRPKSVVDVGCGVGTWLKAARNLGVEQILGIDNHVPKHLLHIGDDEFMEADLARSVPDLGRRFDLALSLEVAEHLPAGRSDDFVRGLCGLADVVLFSAAIPYQGGQEHINEQWQSAWSSRFADCAYEVFDLVRPVVWMDAQVEYWYQQNALVFVSSARGDLVERATDMAHASPLTLDVVHPQPWERISKIARRDPTFRPAFQQMLAAARGAANHRLAKFRHLPRTPYRDRTLR